MTGNPPNQDEIRQKVRQRQEEASSSAGQEEDAPSPWDVAREQFPITDFPGRILPTKIDDSLRQLAKAHSANLLPLPGAALAILSSVLGGTVSIRAKKSWKEILSLWFVDIGPSGSGKTHAPRALCSLLYDAQERAELEYRARVEEENLKSAKERNKIPRARGYFSTDLTLEGLRADVSSPSGHGGQVVILDELSSFLTGQNQYKAGKGNDREMWLAIHDGKPGRASRASDAPFIKGARVSIFGGIQPGIWHQIFGGKNSKALVDGTVQRFLPTIKGPNFIPITDEDWDDYNCEAWKSTLKSAMTWADKRCSEQGWKPFNLTADEAGWDTFKAWANDIKLVALSMPTELNPFVNKMPGHALRLAGAIHCLHRFSNGLDPSPTLSCQDINNGIRAAEFYAGQMVEAMAILKSGEGSACDAPNETVKRLAEVLKSLRGETTDGRLAVGFIHERFNQGLPKEQRIGSARGMGSLLRGQGLTIPAGKHRIGEKSGYSILRWDQKAELFLKRCQQVNMSTNL
ncbi:DUF3987 domain-containing protein [Desulfococcus multivorans]|uniref:DUF3987 domain-containing protein n=1 Tax=Desulfococcus multivorans DSM 2059 TaxID=1121405 RepID=S7TC59_DESML|nr:DUF3987 domain-containing protein [Desulfococcus multivorans]AOY59563.1 uncharacterized protein Dmul_27910 [Desulfococcus multivorans]AQV01755.1 hypothetical protein B2D07_13950 [Desulfococcus multivorans]EPR34211.1 Protein of unknown function DUF3987 [Desulfococcus multivorans DSM 2059]SKA20228.1 Protein of unknown function [Desulfococcus multivorans DSM 2059]